MTSNVSNWEATLHKIVTSKEGDLVGSVDATDETSVLVSSEGAGTHYRVPKHLVGGFDGHAVSLKISKAEIDSYKTSLGEGFREIK